MKRIVEARDDVFFIKRRFKQKLDYLRKIIEYLDELGSLPNLPDKAQLSIFDM